MSELGHISIFITLKNRANLLRYCLDAISKQDYDLDLIEVVIADGGSNDELMALLDEFSDIYRVKYYISDRSKAFIPIKTNIPGADINSGLRWGVSYDTVIKTDPEVIMLDNWLLQEVNYYVNSDPNPRCYNARTHFTTGTNWYNSFEDIKNDYEHHYMVAEGGFFSRSKFYFCSGMSRTEFITAGGVDERMSVGLGYDDTLFRETFKNFYGNYEFEITAQCVHLEHPAGNYPLSLYELNRRQFEQFKTNPFGNAYLETGEDGKQYWKQGDWGNIEMLSKIYTIHKGQIINVEDLTGHAVDVALPF